VLSQPLDTDISAIEEWFTRVFSLQLLFEQANVSLGVPQFLLICAGLGIAGFCVPIALKLHPGVAPAAGIVLASLPFCWVLFRRSHRIKLFAKQLPDALELLSRALRAGHSLGAGLSLVADEMSQPISGEFGRVFEEQNLGIQLDEALNNLTRRMPNLDLRFFATAVILQRQTGGDLAEILDKIGHLVRERFKIWGAVQALTGEGRLSGIVLLALPPGLFVAVYNINPEYVMPLFTDPLGKKMLAGALILQMVGALVIRKIINIKV
jgi:tight adherence protein B